MTRYLADKLWLLSSIFLVLCQMVVLAAYSGLLMSRSDLENIPHQAGENGALMGSPVADALISGPVMLLLSLLFLFSLIKEYRMRQARSKRLWVNLVILLVFISVFFWAADPIFAPITSS